MRIKKFQSAFVALILIFAAAKIFAATIRDDVPDSEYTALGNNSAFDAVGTFSANLSGCGILVASDWVLTAAHLILNASSGTFTLNGTSYSASQIITDPSWNGNPSAGNDFALVHLSSSLTAIPPALFYTGSTPLLGQTATFVGYGLTGNGLTGYRTLDNQKRGFQDVVDVNNPAFGNPADVFGATFLSPANGALPLEGCVAPGDSGGGVFINDGSQYYLAGVISFVDSTNGTSPRSVYGNISGFDSVASALPWILATVPEPQPYYLLPISGIIFLVAAKFRKK